MLYHVGDSQHTQNIQINEVIDENEKRVFYLPEKTKITFWPTQYYACFTAKETNIEELSSLYKNPAVK